MHTENGQEAARRGSRGGKAFVIIPLQSVREYRKRIFTGSKKHIN